MAHSEQIVPDLNEIRKLTHESKTNRKEKIDAAIKILYDDILKVSRDRIRLAANKGKTSAYLYQWDDNQNNIINDISIFELIKRDYDENLINLLRKFFNPTNDSTGYKIFWLKLNIPNRNSFTIIISWGNDSRKSQSTTETASNTDNIDKTEKLERTESEKPEKSEKPDRTEKPEKSEKPKKNKKN